ncbi:MAG: hypothetical protein ACR2H9_04745 [Longimicrobiaceae bacterium]
MPGRCLLLPVAALLLAACAAGSGGQARGAAVTVAVENNLRPEAEVTVRLTSTTGTRRVLGSVPPHSTRRLVFEDRSFSGSYTLVATTADGRTITSRSFSLWSGLQVQWALFSNSLSLDASTAGQ